MPVAASRPEALSLNRVRNQPTERELLLAFTGRIRLQIAKRAFVELRVPPAEREILRVPDACPSGGLEDSVPFYPGWKTTLTYKEIFLIWRVFRRLGRIPEEIGKYSRCDTDTSEQKTRRIEELVLLQC